jgi:5-methylcytosine-specific restriction endonuclease McrA
MSTINYVPNQMSVQDIINRYEKGQIDLNPGFQRASVWRDPDRNKLIDSILRNYPLPSIFLHRSDNDGNTVYYVIDGKQRIESILMFTGYMRGNRFSTWSQLPEMENPEWIDWATLKKKKLQSKILEYRLQTIEVTGETADIIDLFVRINSTGKALTRAERQHAKFFDSAFLKKAGQLASKYEPYFKSVGILSSSQITRMKHIELICELMVSDNAEDVINKKAALEKIMESKAITGQRLDKVVQRTKAGLNRLKQMFPNIHQTRLKRVSDFYSLAVLIQKFEREGLILTDRKRNRLAWDLLVIFSNGVDEVSQLQKQAKGITPGQELFREYLLTVREATDEINHRRKREQILRGLLETLFERKDSARLFSSEQRRILWNTSGDRKCSVCKQPLTWEDFTIDHIDPYSKGGRTELENAALMCRKHNSAKGNRKTTTHRQLARLGRHW